MSEKRAKQVKVVSPDGDNIQVSQKAFDLLYKSKGFKLVGAAKKKTATPSKKTTSKKKTTAAKTKAKSAAGKAGAKADETAEGSAEEGS